MLTIEEVKDHLGIDYVDPMVERKLNHLISVADSMLKGSIGNDYPADDPRAKELACCIIDELYSTRSYTGKENGTIRRLIDDFSLQLRLEMRG